jgi:hypothetical protein
MWCALQRGCIRPAGLPKATRFLVMLRVLCNHWSLIKGMIRTHAKVAQRHVPVV